MGEVSRTRLREVEGDEVAPGDCGLHLVNWTRKLLSHAWIVLLLLLRLGLLQVVAALA